MFNLRSLKKNTNNLDMKILIKYPTKFRIQKCLKQLQEYVRLANNMNNINFVVSIDDDDVESIKQINSILQIHKNIKVFVEKSINKVHAINRNIPDPNTFDILLLMSDDMIPIVKGYDDYIRFKMKKIYPDTDGVLFMNDGYCGPKLNTLCILGSKYYQRFNYIYFPEYKSLWCDNEFMNVAFELNKQTYLNDVIIKHEHPVNNNSVKIDELYLSNDRYYNEDNKLYDSRNPDLYDISVLICTIPSRNTLFLKLFEKINYLIKSLSIKVEVLFDNSTDISIGTKRSLLLTRSRGKYSCFIDDDDDITTEYFIVYQDMFNSGIDYDSAVMNGMFYLNSEQKKPFHHSIQHETWFDDETGYFRNPNHLNLIKTSICKKINYKNQNFGEDYDFSKRLHDSKLINNEYKHDKFQYLYFKIIN
jgi:hypothetical protein